MTSEEYQCCSSIEDFADVSMIVCGWRTKGEVDDVGIFKFSLASANPILTTDFEEVTVARTFLRRTMPTKSSAASMLNPCECDSPEALGGSVVSRKMFQDQGMRTDVEQPRWSQHGTRRNDWLVEMSLQTQIAPRFRTSQVGSRESSVRVARDESSISLGKC